MRYETSTIIKQKSGKFAKNPCNYCGDGTKADSEACEPGESTSTICSRETGSYYGYNSTQTWDFESTSWPTWISASLSSWAQDSSYKYSGSYSYCSTNTSNSSTGTLTLNVTAQTAGTVSFYIYGSSETCCDKLTIYLDDAPQEIFTKSSVSWEQRSYQVSAGTHSFKFTYSKDGSVNSGIDKYCVDYLSAPIVVPYSTTSSNPSTKTCNSDCTLGSGTCYSGWCGDGTKNGPEFCDAGSSNNNNWSQSAHCNSDCTGWAPYCGDGHKDSSEACDGSDVSGSCYVSRTCDGGCDDDYTCYDYYYYSCSGSCTKIKGASYSTGNKSNGGFSVCP